MQISHRFETLDKIDGGKEHVFTWRSDDGEFLFHAMYQSGEDAVTLSDGTTAKRGLVLRLQPNEHPTSYASSQDAQTGVVALQVDGENWTAENYNEIARKIREDFGFSNEQQKAAFAQLASLYNLMATRYGQEFEVGIESTIATTVKDFQKLIQDPQRATISAWLEKQAISLLQRHEPPKALTDAELAPKAEKVRANAITFTHGIREEEGAKHHSFEWFDGDALIAKVRYQSGAWGEMIWMDYPLLDLQPDQDKYISIPFTITDRSNLRTPFLSMEEQLARIKYQGTNYHLKPEQEGVTALMLASVYHLAATHYQKGYEPKDIHDIGSLREYVKASKPHEISAALLKKVDPLLFDETTELAQKLSYQPEDIWPDPRTLMVKQSGFFDDERNLVDVTFMPEHLFELWTSENAEKLADTNIMYSQPKSLGQSIK